MVHWPDRSPFSAWSLFPGGEAKSSRRAAKLRWASFRLATRQWVIGQHLLAALVFSPLKRSSVPLFLKDWIIHFSRWFGRGTPLSLHIITYYVNTINHSSTTQNIFLLHYSLLFAYWIRSTASMSEESARCAYRWVVFNSLINMQIWAVYHNDHMAHWLLEWPLVYWSNAQVLGIQESMNKTRGVNFSY